MSIYHTVCLSFLSIRLLSACPTDFFLFVLLSILHILWRPVLLFAFLFVLLSGCPFICLFFCMSVHLYIRLLSVSPSVYLCFLSVCHSVCLYFCLSIFLSVYTSVHLYACTFVCKSFCLCILLSICLPVLLSVSFSVCVSFCPFVYLCPYVCLYVYITYLRSACLFVFMAFCLS